MKKNLFYTLVLAFSLFSFLSISFAEEPQPAPEAPQAAPAAPQVAPSPAPQEAPKPLEVKEPPKEEVNQAPAPVAQEETLKEKASPQAPAQAAKPEACNCEKPAVEALDKTYVSLEEDEWAGAIKVSTDALNLVKNLSMTCTCPVISVYQDVAQGFLNYATGGSILDSEEEINCPKAKKLYEDALKLFDAALPKIADENLKKKVKDIRDYAQEEKEFVDDECE